jgi:hypothetical protein
MNEISGADIIARKLFDIYCPPILYMSDFEGYMTVGKNGVNTIALSLGAYLKIVLSPNFYLETEPDKFTECSFLASTMLKDRRIIISFILIWSI